MIAFEMMVQTSPAGLALLFAAGILIGIGGCKLRRKKQGNNARLTRLRAKRSWDV